VKVFFHTYPLRTTGGSQIQLDETDFEIGKKHPGSPTTKVNQELSYGSVLTYL
jgi:hypothetical protein